MRQIAAPSAMLRAGGTGTVPGRGDISETLFDRLVSILGGFVSFEALFLLFVFAGTFKAAPELGWFPIDFTLFFFSLSILVAALLWLRRGCSVHGLDNIGMVLYLLLLSWILLSLAWSRISEFNIEKAYKTTLLISWCFCGGYFIVAGQRHRIARFVAIVMIISAAMLLYLGYYKFILGKIDPETGATKGTNYLQYGLCAEYLVAILVSFVAASKGVVRPLLGALGAITVLVFMLFIGARGPLLWAIFTVPLALFFLLLNRNARSYRARFLSVVLWPIIVVGLVSLVLMWAGPGLVQQLMPEMTTVERFDTYSESGYGSSVRGRTRAQWFAFEAWTRAPIIGWGVGEFEEQFPLGAWRYPHNLFLEVLMEQGLVGFGLLAALMGLGLVRAWKLWPTERSRWPVIALILMFVPLLMSRAIHQGFLPDERTLFAFLGVILGLGHRGVDRSGMRERSMTSTASAFRPS
jgi:O-antigen ligase